MGLDDVRRRLPIVDALPRPKDRAILPLAPGESPKPRLAVWEFTLACDQACLHCGPRAGRPRADELSTEEALQLVRDLARMGVGEVSLIGGEAYLRNDFLLVLREIRAQGMLASIVTGGYNLTRARAEAAVEAGLLVAGVSIDGLEQSHDRVRNTPNSWRRAFAALRLLREAGCTVHANTQINDYTRRELPALLELLGAEGVRSWQLQITVPHGNAADHRELLLQPYMLLELYEVLDPLITRAGELGVAIWPANSLGYFGPLERRLRKSQNRYWTGCSAGRAVMGIESDGAIKSCPSLGGPLNIGGNWREHGVATLWQETYQLGYIRHRTVDDLWGYCRECYYAETCMAGCTAAAEPVFGRPGNNPFCHHRALMMDRQRMAPSRSSSRACREPWSPPAPGARWQARNHKHAPVGRALDIVDFGVNLDLPAERRRTRRSLRHPALGIIRPLARADHPVPLRRDRPARVVGQLLRHAHRVSRPLEAHAAGPQIAPHLADRVEAEPRRLTAARDVDHRVVRDQRGPSARELPQQHQQRGREQDRERAPERRPGLPPEPRIKRGHEDQHGRAHADHPEHRPRLDRVLHPPPDQRLVLAQLLGVGQRQRPGGGRRRRSPAPRRRDDLLGRVRLRAAHDLRVDRRRVLLDQPQRHVVTSPRSRGRLDSSTRHRTRLRAPTDSPAVTPRARSQRPVDAREPGVQHLVTQHQRDHGLDHRHRPRQHAG
ncbi:MAG: radical SAM protein, partial [Myxococcales bacterium]|nr:radical SAM protein [Myxococcales bacterium]